MSSIAVDYPFSIQDLDDGPGPLTHVHDKLFLQWNNERRAFVMAQAQEGEQRVIVGNRRAYGYIQRLQDGPGALGAADDGKVLTWNQATKKFVMSAGGVDTSGFLLTDGTRVGATSQAQVFTNGTIQSKIVVPSDSTNAFGFFRANGTTQDLYYDSTNGFFGIGTSNSQVYLTINGTTTEGGIVWLMRDDGVHNLALNDIIGSFEFGCRHGGGINDVCKVRALYTGNGTTRTGSFVFLTRDNGSGINALYIRSDGAIAIKTTVPTAGLDIPASLATLSSVRVRAGVVPTTPNDGDIYQDGALTYYGINATTNAIVNTLRLRRESSGTPAAGFGLGFTALLESSTTTAQDAGRLTWEWDVATHASRASRGKLSAFYTTTERVCISWMANATVPLLGFYGVTPVARPAAYTQTYATAARTVNAYTTDAEAAYTGQDNLQVGSVYAKYADLESLRVAYTNLEAGFLNLLQVVTSMIDDGQAVGLLQ